MTIFKVNYVLEPQDSESEKNSLEKEEKSANWQFNKCYGKCDKMTRTKKLHYRLRTCV